MWLLARFDWCHLAVRLLPVRLSDESRRFAFAKAKRLEVARTSVAKLTDDECQLLYVEIEARLAHATKAHGSAKKAKTAKPAAKYTDQILKILDENQYGLRTYEIAEKTTQPVSNAFGILKLLKRQGRVERHGKRYNTLWTLPGVSPVPRMETIPAAAVAVLSKATGPMDAQRLRDEIMAMLQRSGAKQPSKASLMRGISRLVSTGTLAYHGANEHGPMYVLAAPKGGPHLN